MCQKTWGSARIFALALLFLVGRPALAAGPSISSLSPTSGPVGQSVTINGSNFGSSQGSSTVKFNGTAATPTIWSSTKIVAPVPSAATSGNVVVTVSGTASGGKTFTVTPHILSLSPTSGNVGTSVTIAGTTFGSSQGSSTVKFNGKTTTPTSWNSTTIVAPVPSGATTGNVVVTVSSQASNGVSFTVYVTPSISSLSPTSGAVGASVTISGSNFQATQGSSTIKFNGVAATPTNWTNTQIQAPVPGGSTTGNVVVTVAGLASNGKSFTVLPTPTISSVSPNFAAVGMSVTISGTNFGSSQGSSTVKFNGTAATPTSWSATQITVPVPSGATTGNLVVHTSGVDVNAGTFTVETLTSISVTPSSLSLPINSPQIFVATANYSDGSKQTLGTNATWTSSNTATATISGTGLLTALGEGQTTIQATFGSTSGSTGLTVTGPSFSPVGSLITARFGHTATLMGNGKVLIVGGQDQNHNILASAELYDPTTGSFSATGSLEVARLGHTATLLPNGEVLVAGGASAAGCCVMDAELYDPAAGTFSYTGYMNNARSNHTATLLSNGTVLIAGGASSSSELASAELYDPIAGTFTATGSLVTARQQHTATLLADGTVLIAGGVNTYATVILSSAEIYDPTSGTFSTTGSLNIASDHHTASLLGTGNVLITGGYCGGSCSPYVLARTEMYTPPSKLFTASASMAVARGFHTATLLNNGTVLVVGGESTSPPDTGTAELFDPSSQTFTGAGSLENPRASHTATLLNDGTVLIVGGTGDYGVLASAELYAPTPPPPFSLQVTPAIVNMVAGGTQQFSVVTNLGYPRTDATWGVSDSGLAAITTGSSPTLTALAAGQVTLTATVDGVSAQAQITIAAAGTVPAPGAALWTLPPAPGYAPVQLAQAMPSDTGPDMFSIQTSSDGTRSIVQGLTADGQQSWQNEFPLLNGSSVPDGSGGLLVVENQTCNYGQTTPMTIVDVDGATGEPLWQIAAQGLDGNTLYCYPDAPEMAILQDGSVAIAAPGNTSGLPEFMVVSGSTGQGTSYSIPESQYTGGDGQITNGYSPIGAPMVNSDGSTYVEYEVRQIAYPPKVTSAVLYLLQIAPDGPQTRIQLSSTTEDENLFPGNIIPDGQGGVLATWVIAPSSAPMPTNPYQAADVVSGAVTTTYSLPFTPAHLVFGPDGLPINVSLVLGEGGVAFATDGQSTGDSTNGMGPKAVSFNLASGTVNWAYQVGTQSILSILAAVSPEGGLVLVDSQAGVVQLDPSGNATQTTTSPIGALPQYSWGGNWYAQGTTGTSELLLPLGPDSTSVWAAPNGNASGNASADVLCACDLQTSANGNSESVIAGARSRASHQANAGIQPASVANCAICDLPPTTPLPPNAAPSCTTFPGSAPTYLLLVGDPGLSSHAQGPNFDIAAQTQANLLSGQGNNVVACRVSSVENVVTALTGEGFIAGGVIYFGHGGPFEIKDPVTHRVLGMVSILEPGEPAGDDYNISSMNYNQLAQVTTANGGSNNLGNSASILVLGCSAAVPKQDYYAGGGQVLVIAQLISNATQRGVYAYTQGMYFSINSIAQATSRNYTGEPNPLPASLPLYLVPEGPPGRKPLPKSFTPQAQ